MIKEKNMEIAIHNNTLAIFIDLDIDPRFTSSGKALSYATTEGWLSLKDLGRPDLALSLNLVGKKGGRAWRER
jgi:hypothetical protein